MKIGGTTWAPRSSMEEEEEEEEGKEGKGGILNYKVKKERGEESESIYIKKLDEST